MHVYETDPLGNLPLWYKSCCPFTPCCSSPSTLPFSFRRAKKLLPTQRILCTHWKLLFSRPVHIALAHYQNLLTNGRLSGNTEKNFKHVLYLLGVQPATLRQGRPSKQAGLGIQLQNNYRCKENTFSEKETWWYSAVFSRLSSVCAGEELGRVCVFSRPHFPSPALFSEGFIANQVKFFICQPLTDAKADFNPFQSQSKQCLYTHLLSFLHIQE